MLIIIAEALACLFLSLLSQRVENACISIFFLHTLLRLQHSLSVKLSTSYKLSLGDLFLLSHSVEQLKAPITLSFKLAIVFDTVL